jgi:hypothetical protein
VKVKASQYEIWKIKIIEAVINSWCAGQFEETG